MILRLATANENRSEGEGTTSVVPSPSHQSHRPKLFSCTVARSPPRRGGKSSSCPCGGHEKGGVEGEQGYFRRNHWVPIPQARDLDDLNEQLLSACRADQGRRIGDRKQDVGALMVMERDHLLPLAEEGFELGEVCFPIVDSKGCVKVRTNRYSVPLRAGTKVRVIVLPACIEVWPEGKCVARPERCYGRQQGIRNLER